MPKSKNEIIVVATLLTVLIGLGLWFLFRPTFKQRFEREVAKTVKSINEGGHLSLTEKFSPEFVRYLDQHGFNPQQLLLAVRQMDVNSNATYSVHKWALFDEPNEFAEVEFIRKSPDGNHPFALPFVYRDGKWWITDHFRSDRTFEEIPSL